MSEIQSFGAGRRTFFTTALVSVGVSLLVTFKTHSAITALLNKGHLIPHKYAFVANPAAALLESALITGLTTSFLFCAANYFFKRQAKKAEKEMSALVDDLNSKRQLDTDLQYVAKDLVNYNRLQLYFFVQAMNKVELTALFKEHICTKAFFTHLTQLDIPPPKLLTTEEEVDMQLTEIPEDEVFNEVKSATTFTEEEVDIQPTEEIPEAEVKKTSSPLIDWTPELIKQYIPADTTWETKHEINQAHTISDIIKLSEANVKALFESAEIPEDHRKAHAAIKTDQSIRQKLGEKIVLDWGLRRRRGHR